MGFDVVVKLPSAGLRQCKTVKDFAGGSLTADGHPAILRSITVYYKGIQFTPLLMVHNIWELPSRSQSINLILT